MLEYERPKLYPKQFDAFFHGRRYGLTEASTKAGKTVAAIAWLIEKAFAGDVGQNFWWVAPVSTQAEIAYNRIKQNLSKGTFTTKDTPTPRIQLISGPMIWFKSGDNPDSLFGEDVYAAIVDEASRVKEESWFALRSTLTATQGPVNIIGNVKGRKNWFYRMARMAEKDGPAINMHYAKITVLDAIAAGVIPRSELEDAKRTLPENVFNELYMAEASDDSGNPFGHSHIASCVGLLSESPAVAFGIDLAKKHDWFVVIGLDANGCVCCFQRWQGIPWRDSIRRVHDIVGEDTPALVDSTGIGDPVLEELQVGHGNFRGYHFSQISKQRLMEGLSVSIQGHEISYPSGPIEVELESFEYEYTRFGVRYTAPEGLHDDCVCALALAREQWSTQAPGQSLMKYYSGEIRRLKQQQADETLRPDRGGLEPKSDPIYRPTASETLDNELTQLYLETLHQYDFDEVICFRCRTAVIGPSRVTDGVHIWHEGCV